MGCSRSARMVSEEDGQLPGSNLPLSGDAPPLPVAGLRPRGSESGSLAGARLTLHEGVRAGLGLLATPP